MAGKISKIQYSKFMKLDGGVDEYHDPIEIAVNKLQGNGRTGDIHIDEGKLLVRPGRRLWGPTFDNVFNGVREYIDTNGTSHLLVASDGVLYDVDSSAKTSLGFISRETTHICTHRGKAWINSENIQKKLSGTTLSDVGLAKPGTAATAAAGASTGLTGSYAVKVTFVIETSGVRTYESDPSDASSSVTLANQDLSLTAVPVSGDSRVNARYIYRTTAGGSKYYYDGKISDNTTETYTSSVADSSLGDEVETNHGQPTSAEIGEGANYRMFWIEGSRLYWSEQARVEAYLEYQKSTNFQELPNNGKGTGLKRVYNSATAKDDLYIFQEDSVSILPDADPNRPIHTITSIAGCVQHDTIAVYNSVVVFLTNKNNVGAIINNQYYDISTRSIPTSIENAFNKSGSRGAVIFNYFYALTVQDNAGKLYGTVTWICDLRSIKPVGVGMAEAKWWPWNVDVTYWIQTAAGNVYGLDSNSKRIFEYSFYLKDDQNADSSYTTIVPKARTKNFDGDSLMAFKQPKLFALKGRFQRAVIVTPYAWKTSEKDEMEFEPVETAFIAGVSVMGSQTTVVKDYLEAPIDCRVVGNTFSFEISTNNLDNFFEVVGYQYTFISFARNL